MDERSIVAGLLIVMVLSLLCISVALRTDRNVEKVINTIIEEQQHQEIWLNQLNHSMTELENRLNAPSDPYPANGKEGE